MAIKDIHHVTIGGGQDLMCHWPRQGGLWRWGDELLAGYIESPCDYTDPRQGGHGQSGIWDKGYVRLRRSQDDGMLFNNGASVAEQRRVLRLDEYGTARDGSPSGPPRDVLDMSGKEAVFMMGRAWCGDEVSIQDNRAVRNNIAYCYRSIDRGHQWETTPSILFPHHTKTVVELANNVAPLGDGRYVAWLVGYGGVEGASSPQGAPYSPQLYVTEDQGVSWHFYGEIYGDPSHRIAAFYPQILFLPDGRWLCVLGCWYQAAGARLRWTAVTISDDKGLSWSPPRKIHMWSVSPFPLLLRDGRIVLIYMRRNPDPTGLYAIVSEDLGVTWSKPVCLRDDTVRTGPTGLVDGGYPVAIQMADNRIFAAYYWQHDDQDVPWYGGRKYIAGTFFRVS